MNGRWDAVLLGMTAIGVVGVLAFVWMTRDREPAPVARETGWSPQYGPGGQADAIYMNGVPVWSRS